MFSRLCLDCQHKLITSFWKGYITNKHIFNKTDFKFFKLVGFYLGVGLGMNLAFIEKPHTFHIFKMWSHVNNMCSIIKVPVIITTTNHFIWRHDDVDAFLWFRWCNHLTSLSANRIGVLDTCFRHCHAQCVPCSAIFWCSISFPTQGTWLHMQTRYLTKDSDSSKKELK